MSKKEKEEEELERWKKAPEEVGKLKNRHEISGKIFKKIIKHLEKLNSSLKGADIDKKTIERLQKILNDLIKGQGDFVPPKPVPNEDTTRNLDISSMDDNTEHDDRVEAGLNKDFATVSEQDMKNRVLNANQEFDDRLKFAWREINPNANSAGYTWKNPPWGTTGISIEEIKKIQNKVVDNNKVGLGALKDLANRAGKQVREAEKKTGGRRRTRYRRKIKKTRRKNRKHTKGTRRRRTRHTRRT